LKLIKHKSEESAGKVKSRVCDGSKRAVENASKSTRSHFVKSSMAYYDYLNTHRVSQLNRISDALHHLEQLKQQNETESAQL
jgi:hypothetical protein